MKTYNTFKEAIDENKETLIKYRNYILDGKQTGDNIPNLKEIFYIERTDISIIIINELMNNAK